MNQILFAAVLAATLSVAVQAGAQSSVYEEDGIAASPKVRQALNERKASANASAIAARNRVITTAASTRDQPAASAGIAASPKLSQQLAELNKHSAPASSMGTAASTSSQPTGADGIAASPKLRQALEERSTTAMVAPVK